MGRRFLDHSANERTFLSWVRTAISIVGFGILVVRLAGDSSGSTGLGNSGLILLALGAAMVVGAGVRFFLLKNHIAQGKADSEVPVLLDVILIVTLTLLIGALFMFGTHLMV